MKHSLKRSVSVLLAVLFVLLTLAVLAFAAEEDEIVKPEDCDHEYETLLDYSCLDEEGTTPYVVKFCPICRDTQQVTVSRKSHKYKVQEAVPATCIADGMTEGKYCERCGKVVAEPKVVEKKDHADKDYDGWCDFCKTELEEHCPYCGEVHTGFFGRIIGFFHQIMFGIKDMFRF